MKRLFCLALAVCLACSVLLCGCRRGLDQDESTDGGIPSTSGTTDTTGMTNGTTDTTGMTNGTTLPGTTGGAAGNQETSTGQ